MFDNSLWQATADAPLNAAKFTGVQQTEIAIIGGGLTGLSAAFHLAKSGRQVTLLEGKTVGYGGSGRNNGQVIPTLAGVEPDALIKRHGEKGRGFVNLVRDSADELFKLVKQLKIDCDAEQSGWFQPSHSPSHLQLSKNRVESWQSFGANVSLLDKTACDQLLGSKNWHGGMYNPSGGHINPLKLVRGLASACRDSGVQIFENTAAEKIVQTSRGWQIDTASGPLFADVLLLASNAYTGAIAPQIRQSIVPITAWQLATKPLSTAQQASIIPGRQAVSDTRGDLQYFRYTKDNRLVTGASLVVPIRSVSRLKTLVARRLKNAFPQLGEVEFTHIWNGFVGISADFTPRFHMLGSNYYSFTGYNGRGLALALSVGREFAHVINDQPCALPFDPPRLIALHGLVRHIARSRLILTRINDAKPMRKSP